MNARCLKCGLGLAAWLVLALPLAAPVAGQDTSNLVLRYRLIELPAEGGGQSRAYSLNNTGQVVGWIETEDTRHPAHWHNRVTTDLHGVVHFVLLHPYPEYWLYDQNYGEAYHISDADQIVGTARTTIKPTGDEIIVTHAFVLRPAVLTDLATPYPGDALTNLGTFGGLDSAAVSISNRSHVVGWADRGDRTTRAFLVVPKNGQFFVDEDSDGVNDLMEDLGVLSAFADPVSSATAVNDNGQVTGYAYTVTSAGKTAYRAFLINPVDTDSDGVVDTWFTGTSGVNNLMLDAGTLGGLNSWGRDISNNGEIVGETDYDHPSGAHYTHGFYYKDGPMADLGTLQTDHSTGFSAASAINNKGVIVGWAENDNSDRRAFVYSNGTMQDLNDLLYLVDNEGFAVVSTIDLTEARDINDDGVIVGWGTIHGTNGTQTRGFLLNPVLVDPQQLAALDPNNPDATAPPAPPTPATLGTNYSSEFTYGSQNANTPDDANQPAAADNTTTPAPLTFCAPTSLSFIPLTLAGLIWMSARNRRHAQRR
jgi:probable HAF family extracellular repeat protein